MKRLSRRIASASLALVACLSLPACAAEPASRQAPAPAASTAPAEARPALWKVADEDTTIWLFGTIHALPPDVPWFDGKVARAFQGSQVLVTEIIEEDPAKMQALVMERAVLPKGQTLRGLMTAEERAAYEKALAGIGLPAGAFDAFEPWYAAIGLSTLPLMQSGYSRAAGVEQTLNAEARERGRRHEAVETAEYQLGLFDSFPLAVQKRYLAEVVANLPTLKSDLGQMIAAWQRGDAETLAKIMNATEDDPQLLETMLIGRNREWAGWIARRLDEPGTVFFAVGAGHLAGTGSVQDQLSQRGIKAERVQ